MVQRSVKRSAVRVRWGFSDTPNIKVGEYTIYNDFVHDL